MAQMLSVLEGNCHCGSYRFELSGADLSLTSICTCKHCRKAGCLWLPLSTELVYRIIRDDGHLTKYQSKELEKEFCTVCGTTLKAKHGSGPLRGKAINIRCIRQFNPFEYDRRPEHNSCSGTPLRVPMDGYCDCGKVAVQLLRPLEQLEIREDNCSICTRNAWVGIYPTQSHVLISGHENTHEYCFGRKYNGFPFCKTCGIHVYQNLYGPPQYVIDSMPEVRKQAVRKMLDIKPLNVRVFDDVVLSDQEVQRSDQGTEGYETTVLGFVKGNSVSKAIDSVR